MVRRPRFPLRRLLLVALLGAIVLASRESLFRTWLEEPQRNDVALPERHTRHSPPSESGPPGQSRADDSAWGVLEASVTYVPDGDSLVVLINGRKDRVRIVGVDAPEKGQPFANRSRDFTRSLCSGKTVTLSARGRDKYQRILAEASVDGINVGHELVKAGLAWSYDDGDTTVKAFEAQARAARRGLWSQPHPVAPSQWRRARPSR